MLDPKTEFAHIREIANHQVVIMRTMTNDSLAVNVHYMLRNGTHVAAEFQLPTVGKVKKVFRDACAGKLDGSLHNLIMDAEEAIKVTRSCPTPRRK